MPLCPPALRPLSRRSRRALFALLVTGVALTGCGSSNSVGSGVNLHPSGGGGNLSLGSTTTTAAPKPAGGGGGPATTAARVATTAPPTTSAARVTTTTQAAYVIHINGDSSGQPAFAPTNVAIYQGTRVEWINSDTKAHSVVASDGSFTSPSIAPGGSWTWLASVAGRHDYADGTRPYAVGTLEVASR